MVRLSSDETGSVAESLGSAQRIVFAPELLTGSAVAGAWGYHFGAEFLAGTARWYAMPLALLLGTMALFFAVASIRVWTRKVGWVRWLAAGWSLWSLFGMCLRFFMEK